MSILFYDKVCILYCPSGAVGLNKQPLDLHNHATPQTNQPCVDGSRPLVLLLCHFEYRALSSTYLFEGGHGTFPIWYQGSLTVPLSPVGSILSTSYITEMNCPMDVHIALWLSI